MNPPSAKLSKKIRTVRQNDAILFRKLFLMNMSVSIAVFFFVEILVQGKALPLGNDDGLG